jgi:hypothetical protein
VKTEKARNQENSNRSGITGLSLTTDECSRRKN